MSYVLSDRPPLTVPIEIAEIIGLNEAIIIQQMHFWCCINRQAGRNLKEGYYWTFNSYEDWQKQFPFWSVPTIKRVINKIEKDGYIITGRFNKFQIDRTKWYRINYKKLSEDTGIYTMEALRKEVRGKKGSPEDMIIDSFHRAGATKQATQEVYDMIGSVITGGKK